MTYDVLIIGAGITGCVLAERLASRGKKILIIDKRDHIGGNCYDKLKQGVMMHKYGSHQFRTNSKKVKDYLSKFTEFVPFEVTSKASIKGKLYTFPINMDTINEVFKTQFHHPDQVRVFLDFLKVRNEYHDYPNSEAAIKSEVGEILYEMFYKYYTIKQWGLHPTELDASVCKRVPIYYDKSNSQAKDKERIMPKYGYTSMFLRMLNHPYITIKLNTDWWKIALSPNPSLTIWTGKIDEFFKYKYGKLPYRSLKFEYTEYRTEYHQPCYKIAYPTMEEDYTKSIEYKYLTGQKCDNTIVSKEFPTSHGPPFYPIMTKENKELYKKYKKAADKMQDVIFIGRLAEYKYIDMDECVENALTKVDELIKLEGKNEKNKINSSE